MAYVQFGSPRPTYPTVSYKPPTTYQPTSGGTPTTYTVPQPPPLPPVSSLPPAPALPQIPQFQSTAIPQIQQLLGMFQNFNAYPALPADVANLINTQMSAYANKAQDKQLASLFGRGVPVSSIAGQESATLSAELAAAQAAMELAARQQAGQTQLQSLGAQGGILGTLGGIESNAYSQNLQGLLGLAGLQQQQYGTQLGALSGLQSQQYGAQLAAQQQQQAMAQDIIRLILSGQFGGGGMNLGGASGGGGFNFGGTSPNTSSPSAGVTWQPNYPAPTNPSQVPTQNDIWALIWNYLQGVLG